MSTAAELFAEPLDWLFWRPSRPRIDSAWIGHIPFAHWVVDAARPNLLVELGTFSGASYAGFCEAVVQTGQQTRCFAVDTWQGDEHIGSYGEQTYADFSAFNAQRYGGFSKALRMTFDAAAGHFADGSIDLLHIDGFHTYDAVRHDFETWRGKLSERAIVLFHDTAERKGDFGVWKYWEELRREHAGFEFLHSHGLGVLRVGARQEARAQVLFDIADAAEVAKAQARFTALGEAVRLNGYAAKLHFENAALKQSLRRG
jgi:hypothetical protein